MAVSIQQIMVFLLILGRIAGVFIQAPLLNSRSIAFFAKTSIAVWASIVLWFVIPVSPTLPGSSPAFLLALVFEVAVGFAIGFICNIIFIAVQSAGEIIDLQMGLSVATALDPIFGSVISVVGKLAFFTALIIFIAANGHHLIFSALYQSFSALPAGKLANFTSPELALQFISLGSMLWMTAIRIAAPVVLLIFLSDFSFGIVSRVAPQVNVFMLGFQVKPLLGLFGLSLCFPFIVKYINNLLAVMIEQLTLLSMAIK